MIDALIDARERINETVPSTVNSRCSPTLSSMNCSEDRFGDSSQKENHGSGMKI